MRVYVRPQRQLSHAMERVADALERHAPESVEIVSDPVEADVQVLHVVGDGVDSLNRLAAPNYAVIQYCHASANRSERLDGLWTGARLVWSYLPSVADALDGDLYFAPLGIDPIFRLPTNGREKDLGLMTSGYVSGPGAEAIEEAALAADAAGLAVIHLGPDPKGMSEFPRRWSAVENLTDEELSEVYDRSLWVSGLRHIEGFELPVAEGLARQARPVVFDRPDMRQWWDGHAEFVPEATGPELVEVLTDLFADPPEPVGDAEREAVLARFDWQPIAEGFWEAIA